MRRSLRFRPLLEPLADGLHRARRAAYVHFCGTPTSPRPFWIRDAAPDAAAPPSCPAAMTDSGRAQLDNPMLTEREMLAGRIPRRDPELLSIARRLAPSRPAERDPAAPPCPFPLLRSSSRAEEDVWIGPFLLRLWRERVPREAHVHQHELRLPRLGRHSDRRGWVDRPERSALHGVSSVAGLRAHRCWMDA